LSELHVSILSLVNSLTVVGFQDGWQIAYLCKTIKDVDDALARKREIEFNGDAFA